MPNLSNIVINMGVVLLFCAAYLLVISEEFTGLRKSKVVIFIAGLIWALLAWQLQQLGYPNLAKQIVHHALMAYIELALFLLVVMTYIKVLQSSRVFLAFATWLLAKGLSWRQFYWLVCGLTFVLAPIVGSLITSLIMVTLVMAMNDTDTKFINISCIAIVVAANAGGVFSPLGDITTQMLWQHGILSWADLKYLLVPALINGLLPITVMSYFIATPVLEPPQPVSMKPNGKWFMLLFMLTLITAFAFRYYLQLPAVIGMMVGLGYLMFFGYYLKITKGRQAARKGIVVGKKFDIFTKIRRIEWGTILFLYGGLLCLTGLATVGYLQIAAQGSYVDWNAMFHDNYLLIVITGFVSAMLGNIPVLHGLLSLNLDLSNQQWQMLTLAIGLGGSLLPLGSVVGILLLGQARHKYTFMGHVKWFWVIALGYLAAMAYCSW